MYILLAVGEGGRLEARLHEGRYDDATFNGSFTVVATGGEPQVANNIEGVLAALCRGRCRAEAVIIPMSVVNQTVGLSPDVRGYG